MLPACTRCRRRLPPEIINAAGMQDCPSCGVAVRVDAFPALFRDPRPGQAGEALVVEDTSSCFYHPQKKAVVHCQGCGRFLCALCNVEFAGKHLCPPCLETGKLSGRMKNLQGQRILYDSMALGVALVPMVLMWPVTVLSAPLAIFLAIRYWKTPLSIIPRTRVRFVLAIIVGSLQMGGWSLLIYSLITG